MKNIKPNWGTAVVITVLFILSQWVWGRVLGVDYKTIPDSPGNLFAGMLLRVGFTAVIFTVIGVYLNRSWGGVYVQDVPRLPGWMWVMPLIIVVASVLLIADNDWGARGGGLYVLVLTIGTLIVGLAEETAFRGIVVRAIRGSTKSEFAVMVGSCVLFGVLHAVNILNGAEIGKTLSQIVIAAIAGGWLYVTLRLTGSLTVPILLHALFDFSTVGKSGEYGTLGTISVLLPYLVYLLSFVAAIMILVSDRRARADAVSRTA